MRESRNLPGDGGRQRGGRLHLPLREVPRPQGGVRVDGGGGDGEGGGGGECDPPVTLNAISFVRDTGRSKLVMSF